jgi:exonuclease III
MQWIINGYYTHFKDLKLLISEKNTVVVCLQETNLKLKQEPEIRNHKAYTTSVDAPKSQPWSSNLDKVRRQLRRNTTGYKP